MLARTDEKRIRRLKLSKALHFDCKGLNSPCVQWAQSADELKQAFRLVHDEYLKVDYIKKPDPSGMYFGMHNLLPDTATLVIKSDNKVVATLTQVPDTTENGLPMDRIYGPELNRLRRQGRNIAELCALVTSKQLRWKNLYMQMSRTMYRHALCNGIDDFCIMVNPKHVSFYKMIFLFEEMGPEKYYPNLGVPAVALRADLKMMKNRLENKYGSMDCDCNLYSYLHTKQAPQHGYPLADDLLPPRQTSMEMMSYFGVEPATQSKNYSAMVAAA